MVGRRVRRELTVFEIRHAKWLRLVLFALAVGSYLFDRDDVIWVFAPWHTAPERAVARSIFACAALLVAVAASLRTWAQAYESCDSSYELEAKGGTWYANGPFRHVRNPFAVGDLIFVAGIGFLLSRTGVLVAFVGIALLNLRFVAGRERKLGKEYGERWSELCRIVPRFLGSLRHRIPAKGNEPQWGKAFRVEASYWGYFLMLTAFAASLRDGVAWSLGAAALCVSLLLNLPRRQAAVVGT